MNRTATTFAVLAGMLLAYYALVGRRHLAEIAAGNAELADAYARYEAADQEAATEATAFQRVLWQEAERQALEEVEKAGVEIIRPDKSLFIEKTKGQLEAFKRDPAMRLLIEKIQAIR